MMADMALIRYCHNYECLYFYDNEWLIDHYCALKIIVDPNIKVKNPNGIYLASSPPVHALNEASGILNQVSCQ